VLTWALLRVVQALISNERLWELGIPVWSFMVPLSRIENTFQETLSAL